MVYLLLRGKKKCEGQKNLDGGKKIASSIGEGVCPLRRKEHRLIGAEHTTVSLGFFGLLGSQRREDFLLCTFQREEMRRKRTEESRNRGKRKKFRDFCAGAHFRKRKTPLQLS